MFDQAGVVVSCKRLAVFVDQSAQLGGVVVGVDLSQLVVSVTERLYITNTHRKHGELTGSLQSIQSHGVEAERLTLMNRPTICDVYLGRCCTLP